MLRGLIINTFQTGVKYVKSRAKRRLFFIEPLTRPEDPDWMDAGPEVFRPVKAWCLCGGKSKSVTLYVGPCNPEVDEMLYY